MSLCPYVCHTRHYSVYRLSQPLSIKLMLDWPKQVFSVMHVTAKISCKIYALVNCNKCDYNHVLKICEAHLEVHASTTNGVNCMKHNRSFIIIQLCNESRGKLWMCKNWLGTVLRRTSSVMPLVCSKSSFVWFSI